MSLVRNWNYFNAIVFSIVVCLLVRSVTADVNGGKSCAGCTVLVGLVEQLAQVYNETIEKSLERFCGYLPDGSYTLACKQLVHTFGPIFIKLWNKKNTPDVICHVMNFCYTDPGEPTCHLFPSPHIDSDEPFLKYVEKIRLSVENNNKIEKLPSPRHVDVCKIPGVHFLCELWDKFATMHKPLFDSDNDNFSTVEAFRGTNWRGRDCDDSAKSIHPGARPLNKDIWKDSNCNGIYGLDPKSGKSYEELLCDKTGQRGVAYLGDSAGAHFHIPPEWLRPKKLNKEVLLNLPSIVENEFDWPMLSGGTGFRNITYPLIQGPTVSAYFSMRQRNRCNHRDYQNICVNGADSYKMANIQESLARSHLKDHPLLLFYALVGNDVCNHYPDTEAHMTTVEDMRENLLNTLTYLDTILPNGSFVMIMGVADGSVLYDKLHKRFHPVGELNKDVTYPQFYDYFNCLQISPCRGWMNSNATARDITSKRAKLLSDALKLVVQQYNGVFTNIKVDYIDCPFTKVIDDWEKKYGAGTGWQVIEPVDGFHPNQYAVSLSAKLIWNYMEKNVPEFIGDVNPHNDMIASIFGDQGGY